MAKVEYQNEEDLVKSLTDLEVRKEELSKTVDAILNSEVINKKGLARVMKLLANYPKSPKQKLVNADEGALLTTMMEIKNVQVSMIMLIDAINRIANSKKQGETDEL